MLREFGSGSGLLELTREAYTNGNPGDVNVQVTLPANAPRHATAVSPPIQAPERAAAQAPAAPQSATGGGHTDAGSSEFERQFSVVSMALTMANKLVLAHKAELTNVRSNQRLAWAIVGVLLLVFFGTAYWGLNHRHDAETTRTLAANAQIIFDKDKQKAETLEKELAVSKLNYDKTIDQLRASQTENTALSNTVRTAEDRARTLERDWQKARTDLEQAKAAQDRAEKEVAALAKDIKALEAKLASKTPAAQPE